MITSVFSLQEIKYAYNHRYIYDQLLKCTSPEEFVMTLDIMRCSMSFPITDFKAIISEVIENYYMLGIKANHKPEIILDLIKNYSIFDDAIKTTQLPKLVLKIRSKLEPSMQRYKICQMFLAVMFNKFPELFTMQFNYRKRNKIKYQRFTENDMKKYLV